MLTECEAQVTVAWMKLRSSVKQAFSHPVTQHLGLGTGAQLFPLVTLSSEGGDARTRQPQTLKTQAHQWRHGTVYTLKKIYYRIWLVYYFTPTNNPGNVFILTVLVYKISKHTGWWEESDPLHRRVCGRSLPHWIYADANHLSAKISPWLTFHPSGATLNRETSACRNAAHETDSSQNALWSACSSRVEG